MRVIGAGLPRTATTTLLVALEQLGFGPCYHMRDLLADLENGLPLWEAVADGDRNWEQIFDGAQSTVDWPSARYWSELIEHYTDAKVVLSVRPGEAWVRSMRKTVWGMYHGDSVIHHVSDARAVLDPLWRRFIALMTRMTWDESTGALAGDSYNDDRFIDLMERWNDDVKRRVPPERLLVWDPSEGWEPLCQFLELPVPDVPLPHVNDRTEFLNRIIDGALQALQEWRARQTTVEPSFAVSG